MTPSQTEAGAAVPGPSEPAPEAQVLEELRAIDTSVLEKLTEIRTEQTRLARYRAKGAELKGTVKEPVWQRVLGDYAARSSILEGLAAPLKVELQHEYQKLRALHVRITASYDEALLAKEELEFREAVGELSKTDLKAKLDGPQSIIDRCQRDLAAVETQKAKFVAAIGSEAELEEQPNPSTASLSKSPSPAKPAATPDRATPAEPAPPFERATTPERATTAERATTPKRAPTTERATASERVAEPAPSPDVEVNRVSADAVPTATPVSDDRTRLVSGRGAPSKPARVSTDSADPLRTSILSRAAVYVSLGGAETTEHHLGAISLIGRTEENHIRLTGPGVSRRHALIKGTPTGFVLKDFGSQNGTFVNGERVSETERPLVEGDRIVIGEAQLLFRFLS